MMRVCARDTYCGVCTCVRDDGDPEQAVLSQWQMNAIGMTSGVAPTLKA